MRNLADQLREAATAAALVDVGAAGYANLSDDELLEVQKQLVTIRRQYETHAAWAAGEIARRSSRELGFSGLAQRKGFLTPEALIQSSTGGTRTDAAKLIAVGVVMGETEAAEDLREADPTSPFSTLPWLAVVAQAVRSGTVSLDAAEAIRKGLGDIDPAVSAEKLAAAALFLLGEAASLNADQLHRRARRLRDQLDADGISRREKTQRDARSFRIWKQADGMYRVSAVLPPEDGRLVELIVDGATSPRRGGPRFIDPRTQERADALQNDARSIEQIAADTILALLQIAVEADPNTVFFGRRPTVRVLVTESDLTDQTGHGELEGHPDPVSIETAARLACSGVTGIKFDDDGQCINVGRDQRLFTARQRIGLAARDGGCRWPGCDRPASWCEAHHINQWKADHGHTDMADGVLLCRAHHLLLHNNHWQVTRTDAAYWLSPPTSLDPEQKPRPMPSKSSRMLELFPSSPAAELTKGRATEPSAEQEREPAKERAKELANAPAAEPRKEQTGWPLVDFGPADRIMSQLSRASQLSNQLSSAPYPERPAQQPDSPAGRPSTQPGSPI